MDILDGAWGIVASAGPPLLFVLGVALGTAVGYWLVARGPMGRALDATTSALIRATATVESSLKLQAEYNAKIIKLQNCVDVAEDAGRALQKELGAAERRQQLREEEYACELTALSAELSAVTGRVTALEAENTTLKAKVSDKDRRIEGLLKRVCNLETEGLDKDKRIAELERALTEANTARQDVESRLTVLQEKVNHSDVTGALGAPVSDCGAGTQADTQTEQTKQEPGEG